MSEIAIRVENLSKLYRIGAAQERHDTLRDALTGLLRRGNGRRPASDTDLWALKDVSFEVKRGEVVGIIGRNGAGKSTLLKILSRITEPTSGRAMINGRVGSLLEVGTGFHPELTGRENIYLNGAILGMRRREIDRRFDEIVDFAGIERFLDTPVKRYSSGMYVRLAFAVAAHLEPEILLVDEVLAVGDAAFQKKCLGKMGEVAREGRTVLFVSHNMGAVRQLCSYAVLFNAGKIWKTGSSDEVIQEYIGAEENGEDSCDRGWDENAAPGNESMRVTRVQIRDYRGISKSSFGTSEPIILDIYYHVFNDITALTNGLYLHNQLGIHVFYSTDSDNSQLEALHKRPGIYRSSCVIPAHLLNVGKYVISIDSRIPNIQSICYIPNILRFTVVPNGGPATILGPRSSVVCPLLDWNIDRLDQ